MCVLPKLYMILSSAANNDRVLFKMSNPKKGDNAPGLPQKLQSMLSSEPETQGTVAGQISRCCT